jgi:hypothetical protein
MNKIPVRISETSDGMYKHKYIQVFDKNLFNVIGTFSWQSGGGTDQHLSRWYAFTTEISTNNVSFILKMAELTKKIMKNTDRSPEQALHIINADIHQTINGELVSLSNKGKCFYKAMRGTAYLFGFISLNDYTVQADLKIEAKKKGYDFAGLEAVKAFDIDF